MTINWLKPSSYYTVVCRPALPKDSEEVLAFTKLIWDGRDYVPYVWERWLADPDSLLVVAEYGGRVVGVSRLAPQGNQEWWLQALRVHPDFEGRGIASRLHDYLLEIWSRQGGALRLATSAHRFPVHHLCQRTGFHLAAELMGYAASALQQACELQQVGEAQLERLEQVVRQSPTMSWTGGLMDLIWEWVEPTVERLRQVIEDGGAWSWAGTPGSPDNYLLVDTDDDEDGLGPFLQLLAVACPEDQLAPALLELRRLAAQIGYSRVKWVAPLNPAATAALESAGYEQKWERSLYLFEKRAGADMV